MATSSVLIESKEHLSVIVPTTPAHMYHTTPSTKYSPTASTPQGGGSQVLESGHLPDSVEDRLAHSSQDIQSLIYPEQIPQSLSDIKPNAAESDTDVEVDQEVWDSVVYHQKGVENQFYVIRVPTSSENVLIAHSKHTYDQWFHVPGSRSRRWPILTSKVYNILIIPPAFAEWMGSITQFLRKSEEYLSPYENYVKRRRQACVFYMVLAIIVIIAGVVTEIVENNELYLLILLGAVPFLVFMFGTYFRIKTGLDNGVKALKLCGKYEKSVLPPNIQVVFGPYGTYWKFTLRS